ncbi:hypothetical protein KDA_76840 [Dictyobacter alpinus]|uniref:Peptidase C51 domain-containing protein n=1 Tax=Dictyobacter alpinus TaxID=2014873 RepID=A0A402BLL8_9CHLR|nr:CHAP domain-containing protein [Dictyobacter alpinus]GCE32200.1 hypothetical protein KDA_76840 [Dictyobacter alpinus]
MILETVDRNKWRLLFWFLGTTGLGSVLASILGFLVLVLIIVSLIGSALHSDGFKTYQPVTAPAQTITKNGDGTITWSNEWVGLNNQPVVSWAQKMSPHLVRCGVANYTQCYDSGFPQAVLDFWSQTCSGPCYQYWMNGNLQCVMFVTGAYGAAGQQLPSARNAVLFWEDYAGLSEWTEYANGTALPVPGDIIVWQDGENVAYPGTGAGHVAIVTDVQAPTKDATGFVQFAQGNSVNLVDTQPIDTNGYMHTWPGYKVLGFIRHTSFFSK